MLHTVKIKKKNKKQAFSAPNKCSDPQTLHGWPMLENSVVICHLFWTENVSRLRSAFARPEIDLTQYRSLKLIIATKYFRCSHTGWNLKIFFFFPHLSTKLG